MITGITNTPTFSARNNNVTFTAAPKRVSKITNTVVNEAFKKLAQNRPQNQLGQILATAKNNVNICLREIKFGKVAELILSNGKFDGKDYAIFTLKRGARASEIVPETQEMSKRRAQSTVKKYIIG